jgi:hypothetical protein
VRAVDARDGKGPRWCTLSSERESESVWRRGEGGEERALERERERVSEWVLIERE